MNENEAWRGEQEPEPVAYIELQNGPMDGAKITWPGNCGDFPAIIQFGHYLTTEGDSINDARTIRHHSYSAYHGEAIGKSECDGLPLIECQFYIYAGHKDEGVDSIRSMWDNCS
jgi:hypothetical protein